MDVNIKIAGTTFHPLPDGMYVKIDESYMVEDIPCAKTQAVLMPEPQNPYDPEAVMVLVPLENGEAFHIGYLPKMEPLKKRITGPTPARVLIQNFTQKNPALSPAWTIVEVFGGVARP